MTRRLPRGRSRARWVRSREQTAQRSSSFQPMACTLLVLQGQVRRGPPGGPSPAESGGSLWVRASPPRPPGAPQGRALLPRRRLLELPPASVSLPLGLQAVRATPAESAEDESRSGPTAPVRPSARLGPHGSSEMLPSEGWAKGWMCFGDSTALGKGGPCGCRTQSPNLGGRCPQPWAPLPSAKADTDPQPPRLTDFGMLLWALASRPAQPSVAAHQESTGGCSGGGGFGVRPGWGLSKTPQINRVRLPAVGPAVFMWSAVVGTASLLSH